MRLVSCACVAPVNEDETTSELDGEKGRSERKEIR